MSENVVIALDAMGGDHAPDIVISGAMLALQENPSLRFIFCGDQTQIKPLLEPCPELARSSRLIHTDVMIGMEDKPSQALRRGRWRSSMWLALDAVRKGEAHATVSAGNTGALMAMALFCLKTMSTINRPAIAVTLPNILGEKSILLDAGATIGATAEQLVEFALMGEAMARALLGVEQPRLALLNIGVEEAKGLDEIRKAHQLLKNSELPITYAGFIEGSDLCMGYVDVIVTEGFSGNIALKTAEGVARFVRTQLKNIWKKQPLWLRWADILFYPVFRELRGLTDTGSMNGGILLGLNGIVIKSHGGADARAFASAVRLGHDMVRNGLLAKIESDLACYHGKSSSGQPGLVVTS
ncbi:MAG: phosphate acyltransferase PlsX [Alphaproteobacteria bacterium]|nr:phosphate acyltransferase PlsX [Alphaproteobacteria bacterium]